MEKEYKILLTEDDENLGMLLREYLEAKGYETDLMPDGEQGYDAFMNKKYDVCIFDVMMPKKDGFTLAKEIRMVNTDVPIIFLTAKSMKEDIFQALKLAPTITSPSRSAWKSCCSASKLFYAVPKADWPTRKCFSSENSSSTHRNSN
ncbi:response regulator [Marinilabilia salmonicolor]|uniref:response regulator n=1 Tax=Marinilabilia salmonicolor TaxID=989 RepID=UPI003571088A